MKRNPRNGAPDPADILDDAEAIPAGDADATGLPAAEDEIDQPATPALDAGAEQEIAALAAEVARQKDKVLRTMAEFDNYRKRMVRERQEAELKGMGLLIKGILDALDDLGRFAHLDPAGTDTKTVVDGVELVERKLLKSLAGHGLEVVNPVDAPFDPTYQEALTTVPAATKEEDHLVAQVYQVGYVFNGMLLRPARVVVKQWQGGADASA
ncbi:MAG: nucleotide exchange factor GrpE [Gemmatimonadota bacterium]|nr:nucleotide exchange factor GrpE [Gemmatimonadota bacterium]